MKFLIILPRFNRSGATRVSTELANGLARRGHHVTLIVPAGKDVPFYPVAEGIVLKRPHIPFAGLADRDVVGGLVRRLAILFALEPADVAVVTPNLDAFLLYAGVQFVRIKKPVYFSMCYEPISGELTARNFRAVRKFLASLSYRLPMIRVTDSVAVRDLIRTNHGTTFTVANPGVDAAVFYPRYARGPNGPVRILTFGSSETRRAFGVFVEAMDLVRAKRSSFEVWVLLRDESAYPRSGYPVRIVRAPTDNDLAELYSAADVFVSTSFWEGYGLPPLEAMACGTACVITDSGGVRDYARDGENCLLVPARSAAVVAEAVIRLMDDPDLRARLGRRGVETGRAFAWDRMVDVIEGLCTLPDSNGS